MGEARLLNLLNIATWLISTCSHPYPFSLRLGDRALAPSVLAPCVYMQRQRQETSRQEMEGKDAKSIWKRHKADKHDRYGIYRNKDASKQVIRQTSEITSKQAKRQTSKQANKKWCPRGTNVGLDWVTITSLCWSMDDTLASKLMHKHVSKRVKMHQKPTCGTNKHGKHINAWSGKGKRYAWSNRHLGNASRMVTSK